MNWWQRLDGIHWDPPGGLGWLFILLALGAVAYSVWVYRRTDAPLSPGFRTLLTTLRALFLLIVIGILCRPVLSLAVPGGADRGVLVLLDRSLSMLLPGADSDETREQEAARVRLALEEELAGFPTSVRPFSMGVGTAIETGDPLPSLDPDGTEIGAALEAGVVNGETGSRPGAIIMVTDGAQTRGADPVPLARRYGIPVAAVALGSREPVADLSLVRVRANRDAFAGERTPIEAVVRNQGLGTQDVTVTVVDATADSTVELARETVRLEPGGAERRLALTIVPKEIGLRFLEVRVSGVDAEATRSNNRRLLAVDVREEKTGVLLLSGRLTWDHTFVRRALESDSTLAVTAGVWNRGRFRSSGGKKTTIPALTKDGLRKTRVIVLDHAQPRQVGSEGARAIREFVQGGGGLVVITGAEGAALTDWSGTGIDDLLPIQVTPGGVPDNVEVRLSATARRHALFDPTVPGAAALEAWTSLPPVTPVAGTGALKAHAEALLVSRGGNSPLNVVTWGPAGQGRVLLFAGAGFWGWDFAGSSRGAVGASLPGWWRRAAQWLSRPILETRFDAHPDHFVVGRGAPVRFVARATDAAYQPLAGVSVDIEITPVDSTRGSARSMSLTGGQGFLSGRLEGIDPGRYHYRARARTASEEIGVVDGVFAVDSLGAELERLEVDHELLGRLAAASGGAMFYPDSLAGVAGVLRNASESEAEIDQVDLWDHPVSFALFVLFGAAEWTLRRRRGLI